MNIIGTGLNGLVGSRVVELLSEYSFTNLSLETGVDITNHELVTQALSASDAPWVFHFAAYTDVDGAEKQKAQGTESVAWKINVEATQHIANLCQKLGKHLVYMSTDYVFDGLADRYTELDIPSPTGWYGITKYEGEKIVCHMGSLGLVIRIANPYRAALAGKPDFVHKILELLDQNKTIQSPGDQKFVPTFIDDIAAAIHLLVQKEASGLYHVVGQDAYTPFDASVLIAKIFGYPQTQIKKTTFANFFEGRAPRPCCAVLSHDKISQYGIRMNTFEEGLLNIQKQIQALHVGK